MNEKKELKLILVADRNHLSRGDLKSLLSYLESDDCEFEISLQISEPTEQPELLELHRLVAIPALIKVSPSPKQIFAGSNIFVQLQTWLPRWKQEGVTKNLGINIQPTKIDTITTQKEFLLEDELLVLRQENETLTKRIESQERLLRMVAHELRTPLTAATLAIQSQKLGQIDITKLQDVIKRRLEEIELLSQDLLEVEQLNGKPFLILKKLI